jgi:hypothetical protein
MKDEKRKARSYKATDSIYIRAVRRARKEKTFLSQKIENWVLWYAAGHDVVISSEQNKTV